MIEHNSVLRCSNIKKHFKTESETGVLEILRGVDFSMRKSEIAAIVGSSGSGKSTLLHILGGLDKPTDGEIFWDEESIYTFKTDQLADLRNEKVGFVFQFHHLLPEFTAAENVLMPAYIKGDDFKKAQQRAESLLERFGLSERLNHRPTQLSGGEQQRVSMARALMNKPKIILADEPTGNLDEKNTENILSLLFELRRTDDVSIVLITHEKDIAKRCDSVYSLQKGLLERQV